MLVSICLPLLQRMLLLWTEKPTNSNPSNISQIEFVSCNLLSIQTDCSFCHDLKGFNISGLCPNDDTLNQIPGKWLLRSKAGDFHRFKKKNLLLTCVELLHAPKTFHANWNLTLKVTFILVQFYTQNMCTNSQWCSGKKELWLVQLKK